MIGRKRRRREDRFEKACDVEEIKDSLGRGTLRIRATLRAQGLHPLHIGLVKPGINGFERNGEASYKQLRIAVTPQSLHVVRRIHTWTQTTAGALAIPRQPLASAPLLFVPS